VELILALREPRRTSSKPAEATTLAAGLSTEASAPHKEPNVPADDGNPPDIVALPAGAQADSGSLDPDMPPGGGDMKGWREPRYT
jgi:hypothetical protein